MYLKITGSSLRTPTSRLLTKKPLIMCREYEEMSNGIPMVGGTITPLQGLYTILIVEVKCMFTERATTRISPIILVVPTQKYLVEHFAHLLTG